MIKGLGAEHSAPSRSWARYGSVEAESNSLREAGWSKKFCAARPGLGGPGARLILRYACRVGLAVAREWSQGEEAMTLLQNIEKLVSRLSPEPVCDTCITEKLDLDPLEHADHAARELAGTNGFELLSGACSLCGETRLVIRRR